MFPSNQAGWGRCGVRGGCTGAQRRGGHARSCSTDAGAAGRAQRRSRWVLCRRCSEKDAFQGASHHVQRTAADPGHSSQQGLRCPVLSPLPTCCTMAASRLWCSPSWASPPPSPSRCTHTPPRRARDCALAAVPCFECPLSLPWPCSVGVILLISAARLPLLPRPGSPVVAPPSHPSRGTATHHTTPHATAAPTHPRRP